MSYFNFHSRLFKNLVNSFVLNKRFVRNGQRQLNILDTHANIYRPENESELEYLAVQTSRKKSLQINYELEQQRKRQRNIRYHILRRKYVVHPNDIKVDLYVKNHMQFLHKNYPKRWTVQMLAESFDQSVDNVRLILKQRTTRQMRVRPRAPSSLFGIKDEEERERLFREHMMKRDLRNSGKPESEKDDGDPVDYQILAEESNLLPRQRPSDDYLKKDNDGFFSNVISSSDQDQQTERDTITKKKLLSSSPSLLDRINKLRLTTHSTHDTYSHNQTSEIYNQRMTIIQKMQQANDSIADMNERKQKFIKKSPSK